MIEQSLYHNWLDKKSQNVIILPCQFVLRKGRHGKIPLTKHSTIYYSQQYRKSIHQKAMTKRSIHYPLKERAAADALKGCLKEGM